MFKIYPNLWIGNRNEVTNVDLQGIVGVIVYLGQEMNDERLTHKNTLPVIHFPLNDGHNAKEKYVLLNGLLSYLINVYDKNVLLCCRYGLSRSPSIAVSYLTVNEKWLFDTAYSYVSRKIKGYAPKPDLLSEIKMLE